MFYGSLTQIKRHELAGFGLTLNYVICPGAVKRHQSLSAALELLSSMIRTLFRVALSANYVFRLKKSLDLHGKVSFTKAAFLGLFSAAKLKPLSHSPPPFLFFLSNPHYAQMNLSGLY